MLHVKIKQVLLWGAKKRLCLFVLSFILCVILLCIIIYNFEYRPEDSLLFEYRSFSTLGNSNVETCISGGDTSVKYIWEKTKGIETLHYYQIARLTSLFVAIDSPLVLSIAWNLWERPVCKDEWIAALKFNNYYNDSAYLSKKLMGAYILARRGMLPKSEIDFLKYTLSFYQSMNDKDSFFWHPINPPFMFSALSLAYTEKEIFFSYIKEVFVKILNTHSDIYAINFPSGIIECCAISRDDSSIIYLRELLTKSFPGDYTNNYNRENDIAPRLLRALILLGDYSSLSIYLERCQASVLLSKSESDRHINILEPLQCLSYLTDNKECKLLYEWQNWYDTKGKNFCLSNSAVNVLQREAEDYAVLSLYSDGASGLINERFPICFSNLQILRRTAIEGQTKN
ncbi:MAG: hypothetical protein BWX80_01388 [Candidatus Hydrogenedentes bacterium ADurb.Bin101]|nr:MAG: hypothetical protein BWX80_01388 [Candidatus Hydrogenedentes bacterium ADurb.Bin101]